MTDTNHADATSTGYAHPHMLVSTAWLADHLDDPNIVVVESDEDVLLYETGHIPGAVKVDWHADLNDPLVRDYLSADDFAELMSTKGIEPTTTVVFYGDNFNWWAAYALWVFSLFGHTDVRLLNGGRQKWIAEGRPLTTGIVERTTSDLPDTDEGRHPSPCLHHGHDCPQWGIAPPHRRPLP